MIAKVLQDRSKYRIVPVRETLPYVLGYFAQGWFVRTAVRDGNGDCARI